jgi:FtsP/CotA-like multicopper oxidase with cupredoxin domain
MSKQSWERPRSGKSPQSEWLIHFTPTHLTGWKDTVLVEDKAELLVAFNQPATHEHPFMYHCHILEHEDARLMGQYVCT